MAAISQSVRVGNAVVLHLPMQYIFVGRCSIYSTAYAVYIHFSGVCIGCLRTFIWFYITMHLISLKRTSSCINAGAVFDIASASMFIILFFLCSFHARFFVVIYIIRSIVILTKFFLGVNIFFYICEYQHFAYFT